MALLSSDQATPSSMWGPSERPGPFKKDEVFNLVSIDRAAQIVHEFSMMNDKAKRKAAATTAVKRDNALPLVTLDKGDDNASSQLHTEARNLRTVNKEIKEQMKWWVTQRVEIIRNLPPKTCVFYQIL